MAVFISLLRGINVGGHNCIKMDALRELYRSLRFEGAQTYVQSGNVVFRSRKKDAAKVARQIQEAIEKKFKCRPEIMVRTLDQMRSVIARNPFARRQDVEPAKLLVSFLLAEPKPGAEKEIEKQNFSPEEIHVSGQEVYIYFPNGIGKSKLPWSRLDKFLGTSGTGRNWNSVTKLLEMAEEIERVAKR